MIKYRYTIEDTSIETLDVNDVPEGMAYKIIEFEIQNNQIIEIPQEVPLWRIRTVLKLMDLEESIKTALNDLEEPIKTAALNIWEYGVTIERNSFTVELLQNILQMTNEDVDNVFLQAKNIEL